MAKVVKGQETLGSLFSHVVEDLRYKVEGKEKEKEVLEKKTLAEALNTTS